MREQQHRRLLIWIEAPAATAALGRIGDAGSDITDGFSADLVDGALQLFVGPTPVLTLASDETALVISEEHPREILFQGPQKPKGRVAGSASLLFKGRERGCLRFSFEMEPSSLTDELPCGFEFFIPDKEKDGEVRQQWYPLFEPLADGAAASSSPSASTLARHSIGFGQIFLQPLRHITSCAGSGAATLAVASAVGSVTVNDSSAAFEQGRVAGLVEIG